MDQCDNYNPDNVFKTFRVIEFPVTFVGLSSTKDLDVEIDLDTCAYLKTMYEGLLVVLLGMPRFCSASGMFTEASVSDFFAIMHQRTASMVWRFRNNPNTILKTLAGKLEGLFVIFWAKLRIPKGVHKIQDAREISASHRAFDIVQINKCVIRIIFNPTNECISQLKRKQTFSNRFIIDLRLIRVEGTHCCFNELHAEIGRYYICGQFEHCVITQQPEVIDFGDVIMNTTKKKYLRIRNESNLIAAKLQYVRVTGFEVVPQTFTILPNSSQRICISIKPTCLKLGYTLVFRIKHSRDVFSCLTSENNTQDENYLPHIIKCQLNILHYKKSKDITVESLHKLQEPDRKYTYVDGELETYRKRKEAAINYLQICKSTCNKKTIIEKFSTGIDKCDLLSMEIKKNTEDLCKPICEKNSIFNSFHIMFIPFVMDFGRVGLGTYGEQGVTIKNSTKYDITIILYKDAYVLYTEDKLINVTLKLKPLSEIKVTIFCLGFVEGNFRGSFEYIIDNKFSRKHTYLLQVGNPTLMIQEKSLKFGMITTECFVTSVPVRIFNHFNVNIDFAWQDVHSDTPFKIIPDSGSIPRQSCKICDVIYICKPTKTKTHEIDFVSKCKVEKIVPIEVSIMTRKLSIKFLQPAVIFKDIALNIVTTQKVKLENSSREIALFHVVEPLISGLKIEPMCGTIQPKMIITFDIVVKISCVLEFAFDIYVKINNKENIILPVSGNVIEPKIIISPKNIYMARIPCCMITYVPVTFQNLSSLKTEVKVLDTEDENIFDVFIAQGNEKHRIHEFSIEGGQSKTVFIKICDTFRREYDMYIPFRINDLLGPPNQDSCSMNLQYYTRIHEQCYENNARVKLKVVNKDISYCRISGVITLPWITFSIDKFEIEYIPDRNNTLIFTMTNISKYYLYVTILTSKLSPNYTLNLVTAESQSIINENNIIFEMNSKQEVIFSLKFHPKGHGKFISTALLYLDKNMTIPYYNLTFVGKRQIPAITPSTYRIIFPPSYVGTELIRLITIKVGTYSDMNSLTCQSKEERNVTVKFVEHKILQALDEEYHTEVTVQIKVSCESADARSLTLNFFHKCGSSCDVEVIFCFTYCPLTLHASTIVEPTENPYPYFPLPSQTEFYEYMTTCSTFIEKWMFLQGFHRDLYPVIPDTFHAISSAISSQSSGIKSKGINISYLSFIRRIAGPLMRHIHKISIHGYEEPYKSVKEIHDTYREIINLLRSRGANLLVLQAKFLLDHDQFGIYTENTTPKSNIDIIFNRECQTNINLFNRLNKQSWIDFILQSYKVLVMDSCFFECVCMSSQPKDIVQIILEWYNEQINLQHNKLLGQHKAIKIITNVTKDMSDGIAIASSIINYCPFMEEHFSIFCEVVDSNREGDIITNACLIIEAMNILKLYFPLSSKDFLNPNFLQMLFLSIHLYVTLPMCKPKDTIKFNPPLLRSSTRQLAISPTNQESLIFNHTILNSNKNNFIVEKAPSSGNGKKMFLNVKYIANFVEEDSCVLLVHGYNKTRIFDTYIVFLLHGYIGLLNPFRKCKVTGPLYRPNKVDILVSSPFSVSATFTIFLTDNEPAIPMNFDENNKPKFYLRRLNLIDREITLSGVPKESGQDIQEHKLYLQLICLSAQIGNSWLWFKSNVGQFFIKVTTQPRWDLAIDMLQARFQTWPLDPCSCGEACECYRTTVLMVPHRNELMLKSLRYALLENASEVMMKVFDSLIESTTGKIILTMLLKEGGTNVAEILHIFRNETTFRISSRSLLPRIDHVTLSQHTGAILPLPITIPANEKSEKFLLTLTSDCGMDIRTYRIVFIEPSDGLSN